MTQVFEPPLKLAPVQAPVTVTLATGLWLLSCTVTVTVALQLFFLTVEEPLNAPTWIVPPVTAGVRAKFWVVVFPAVTATPLAVLGLYPDAEAVTLYVFGVTFVN